jgi:hypothetical protein
LENAIYCEQYLKDSWGSYIISGKVDFKTKIEENIKCREIYRCKHVPNNRTPKYMKQKWSEIKREIGSRNFNTSFSTVDRTIMQKINEKIAD